MLAYFRTAIYNPWQALQGRKVINVEQVASEFPLGTTDGVHYAVDPRRVA